MADPTTLWEILNSEFVKSLTGSAMGALAGAAAGAWAAQQIADRGKVREEALKELRSINAANTLAFSLANAYINLKVQHVSDMWHTFQRDKAAAEKAQATKTEIHLNVDLQTLDPPPVSITDIKRMVLDHTTPPTRALALLDVLERTITQLNAFLTKRNVLATAIKANGGQIDPRAYFGIRRGNIIDQTVETMIGAILSHTDECIFFSTNLCLELSERGQTLKAKLPKKTVANVVTPDFSAAAEHIPTADKFPGWAKENFRKANSDPTGGGLNFWKSTPP
jgi:hypothetical protein